MSWRVRITQFDYERLNAWLHRADRDEHAAFLYAGEMVTAHERCLLVRRVVPVADRDFGTGDVADQPPTGSLLDRVL